MLENTQVFTATDARLTEMLSNITFWFTFHYYEGKKPDLQIIVLSAAPTPLPPALKFCGS
jgi:hypothetical protein